MTVSTSIVTRCLLLDGAAAAGSIRLTQLHLDAGDGLDEAVLIGQDLHGVAEGLEDNALFLGVLDLFLTGSSSAMPRR